MGDVGSIRKCTIKGIPFRVFHDTDASQTPTEYENSTIATSGDAVIKQEKRTQNTEDMILYADKNDMKTLKAIQDSGDKVPLSYTESDGTTQRGTGTINIDTRTTMEGRATVSLLPVGGWSN